MNILLLSGFAAAIWMFWGVYTVAKRYPGYSHRQQVMSELGARSRPTEKIHPFINNYPIGFLFGVFGITLVVSYPNSNELLFIGVLIFLHGLCHWITGLFTCDENLGVTNPSSNQKIHNLAGLLMYFFALFACLIQSVWGAGLFRAYSLLSAGLSFLFLLMMIRSLKTGVNLGLYQRLSYGMVLVWVAALSVLLSFGSLPI